MADKSQCMLCRNYAPLNEPFHYDAAGYADGVTIYGICCKNAKLHSFYPVYVPEGGVCKDFKKKPGVKLQNQPADGQMLMEGI